jgi:hypothetical protein
MIKNRRAGQLADVLLLSIPSDLGKRGWQSLLIAFVMVLLEYRVTIFGVKAQGLGTWQ